MVPFFLPAVIRLIDALQCFFDHARSNRHEAMKPTYGLRRTNAVGQGTMVDEEGM